MNTNEFDKAQHILKQYAGKDIPRAIRIFFFTLIMLYASIFLSYFSLTHGIQVLFYFSVPMTVAFMCRSYVIEHDCGHHSFFRGSKINDLAGNILGFGIMIPYDMWKMIHNSHHLNVGNLDKRDLNPEVWTMTIHEYKEASQSKKTLYRFMRSRFVRLVIVPTINYGLGCRLIHPNFSKRAKKSVIVHDLIYIILFWAVISQIGFQLVFLIYFLPLILFFGIAAYTFYGQHQFEDTYWQYQEDYNWKDASFHGATDLQAPAWFRWLIGNVVYHTSHHIHTSVPFYRLHEAQQALNIAFSFKKLSIKQVWYLMGLKLWDPEQKQLISFQKARERGKI